MLAGLILSFLFAGSEAAYTGFNKMRLDVWIHQGVRSALTARKFTERPENFYTTILLGNNGANTLYSVFATVMLIQYINETLAWLIITFIVLFFGEILPKTLFRLFANQIILRVIFLVQMFFYLFMPVIKIVNKMINLIFRILGQQKRTVRNLYSREELTLLLEESHLRRSKYQEQKYISNILDFASSRVKEAMTPRTEIIAVQKGADWEEVQKLMIESGQFHVPVYGDSLDDIFGVIFLFDMFVQVESIDSIIKPVHYVPESNSCSQVLRDFQERNISIAVVIDEYGGTAGIVSTDDLIEVLFGDFQETFEMIPTAKALNANTWLIDARMDLEELSELIDMEFPEGDFETLAGYILHTKGSIPRRNEEIEFPGYRIKIIDSDPKRIIRIKLIRNID